MKKNMLQKGFTLIELLVVIAIIGILAAVVIGSLNDARSGGQNASIKQTIGNVRTQAEVHYNANSYSYAAVCADSDITALMLAAIRVSNGPTATFTAADGTPSSATAAACHDTASAYAASAPLVNGDYWCVDSTGTSRQTTAVLAASATVCP